jgi:hypothetical protein
MLAALTDGVRIISEPRKTGIDLASVRDQLDCLRRYTHQPAVVKPTRVDETIRVILRPFTMIVMLHGGHVETRNDL